MDYRAEIECACCGKLFTVWASATSEVINQDQFSIPRTKSTNTVEFRVGGDARLQCTNCAESKIGTSECTYENATSISRKPAMDFEIDEKEVTIATQDGHNLYADNLVLSSGSEVFKKMSKAESKTGTSESTYKSTTNISRKHAMDFEIDQREVAIVTQNGHNLYADNLVLSSRSEVFKKMFKAEMMEKQTRKIIIDDVKTETVKDFLFFLYRGEVRRVPSGDNAKELLQLAHRFDVKELVHLLDEYILFELVESPLDLELIKLGFMYDLPQTKEFLIENTTQEIVSKVCGSLGGDCPWYVEYFKRVLASPNITWK